MSACSTTWPFSSPYGSRTRVPGSRGRHPEPLDERAVLSVRRAGVEPAQQSRAGYSRLGSPVPSRHKLSVFPAGVEPAPRPSEGRMPPLHFGNVVTSGPPGNRTPISAMPRRRLPLGRAARVVRPGGRGVNDGARTHLHRLHRPAAHCVAFIHHRGPEGPESPRQDLNLRSPAPEAGALVPYATRGLVQLGSRGSNPDFLVNSQARYRYNTPQFRAPSGSRTRTPCVGSRKAAATS